MTPLRKARIWFGQFRENVLFRRKYAQLEQASVEAQKGWVLDATKALPALTVPSDPTVQVNMLCGHAHHLMGIWASWSLLRYMPAANLVIHSDGSLTDEDIQLWSKIIPGLTVRTRAENTELNAITYKNFPLLHDWVETYHYGHKIGAFHAFGETNAVMDVDSDTLVLQRPNALIKAPLDGKRFGRWNTDLRYAYAYPPHILKDTFSDLVTELPDRLNAGFLLTHRFEAADFAILEEAIKLMKEDPRTDPLRFWTHQTLVAVALGQSGIDAQPLPLDYAVMKGKTRDTAIMRHFSNAPGIRARFFTEGVAMVIDDAIRAHHLPPGFAGR